jgi:hypothetical protein
MVEMTKNRLAPYDHTIIRKISMDALQDIPDESLDFVYIDGNHGLRYIIEDIYEWNRKVRKGGAMSGHDYETNDRSLYSHQACHVKQAVDVCTEILKINNWYILGKWFAVKGEKRDKHRSWLWIKE